MTDAELRDAAVAHLKKTTVGFVNKHWKTPPAGSEWEQALTQLAQIGQVAPPPPPPPPPPPVGTPVDGFSDLNGAFVPQWVSPVVAGGPGGGGIWEDNAGHGPGFKMIVGDAQASTWNTATKNVLAQKTGVAALGSTEDWRFSFMLPAAGNSAFVNAGHAGVLWEFHTQSDSGHHVSLDGSGGTPRLRFRRWMPPFTVGSSGYTNDWVGNLKLDHWYDWRLQIKWSTGSDGFVKCSCDGQQLSDFTGPTIKAGETAKLQFGFYSLRQFTNEVHFAGISRS